MRMLLNETKIQARKYLHFSAALLAMLLLCDAVSVIFRSTPAVVSIAGMIRIIAWCFTICYFAFELFRYGNGANDYLLLTLPSRKTNGLTLKAVTFFCILLVFTLLECPFTAYTLSTHLTGADVAKVIAYDRASRLLGIIAFLLIFMVVSYLSFLFRNVVVSAIFTFGIYLSVTIAEGCMVLLPRLLHQTALTWAIGYNSDFAGASQFINIFPIMVWNNQKTGSLQALGTISGTAIIANLLLIAVFYFIWKLVSSHIPMNYIK